MGSFVSFVRKARNKVRFLRNILLTYKHTHTLQDGSEDLSMKMNVSTKGQISAAVPSLC